MRSIAAIGFHLTVETTFNRKGNSISGDVYKLNIDALKWNNKSLVFFDCQPYFCTGLPRTGYGVWIGLNRVPPGGDTWVWLDGVTHPNPDYDTTVEAPALSGDLSRGGYDLNCGQCRFNFLFTFYILKQFLSIVKFEIRV